MTFSPNDPCTHDSSCFCHWCTGGREDGPPVPKREYLRPTDGSERIQKLADAEEASGVITSVGGLIMKMQGMEEREEWVSVPGLAVTVRKGSQGAMILEALKSGIPQSTTDAISMFTGESDWAVPERWRGIINSLANILISSLLLLQEESELKLAVPRSDLIPVMMIEDLPDGVNVVTVSCPDHDVFSALPGGLEVTGDTYGKSGWNSDKNIAYYRTDRVLGVPR